MPGFLGLVHDVGSAAVQGIIRFRPRTALVDKVIDMCSDALRDNMLSLAVASKILGVVGFTMSGVYGRIGRGGQHAMRQRQYSDSPPWSLSFALCRSLRFYIDAFRVLPRRSVHVRRRVRRPIIVSSDGRLDDSSPASTSALIVDLENDSRQAFLFVLLDHLITL